MNRRLVQASLALGLALAGCTRDPLDKVVSAKRPADYENWRADIASDSGPDLRRRVEEVMQEIRLKAAADLTRGKTGQGTVPVAAIDEAMRKEIDGRPVREVLQLGYEFKVQRLKKELAEFENAMKENAQLTTKPGDLESKHYLEALRGRQTERLEKYRGDLAAAERELDPLMKAAGKTLLPPVTDKPDQMPERAK